MNRRIEWQRAGGKTHRVRITEDVPLTEADIKYRQMLNRTLADYYNSANGFNSYGTPQWGMNQQQAGANAASAGAFGSLLGLL